MKDSSIRDFGSWIANHDWEVYSKSSATDKCTAFYAILQEAINTHFPTKTIKVHSKDKPWITAYTKSLILQRQQLFHTELHSSKWKQLRNKVCRTMKQNKEHY